MLCCFICLRSTRSRQSLLIRGSIYQVLGSSTVPRSLNYTGRVCNADDSHSQTTNMLTTIAIIIPLSKKNGCHHGGGGLTSDFFRFFQMSAPVSEAVMGIYLCRWYCAVTIAWSRSYGSSVICAIGFNLYSRSFCTSCTKTADGAAVESTQLAFMEITI